MTPENSTEKLLMDIANDNSRLKENKVDLINGTAYPDQDVNYAAGKPCAVCPPGREHTFLTPIESRVMT
ncbi:hypothetical protein [Photorhabdus heterorhabditis]|uniref:hypothetical protein n=1 Tax=Photorhabdus heterorhabditis TaxID=880156 RepID=UPI001BD42951|nr:hypothetical protein [Photorhabdus heterorhabditis]MBS9444030.1 hypothetical protein [Photorhabdus heterorhabditis]